MALVLTAAMAFSLSACGSTNATTTTTKKNSSYKEDTSALTFDNTKWNYDADNQVYWQVKVQYCSNPEDTTYETMGIYVPVAYMKGAKNTDGTYTCKVNAKGKVADYTAKTAPVVIPVNTPGYASSAAPTEYSYSDISSYMKAGFVYLQPGIRGRQSGMKTQTTETSGSTATATATSTDTTTASGGAPWGVTDIKAAIRYYRFNQSALPGNADAIFSFGMSGGGAQSALVGATGDSDLYSPYLEKIGAAMYTAGGKTISDAVCGSMCWCPITSLDYADEAYEWMMGQFATTGARADSSFTSALSKDLANSYASYINALKLKNNGKTLTLTKSDSGIYQSGTYYNYILSVIEKSLNNFLSDTTFPYTPTQQATYPGGSNGNMTQKNDTQTAGTDADSTQKIAGQKPSGQMPDGGQMPDKSQMGQAAQGGTQAGNGTTTSSTTYQTAQDYINSLNSDTQWITYDASTNKATITSVEAFVEHCKNATKSVGAFDEIDRGQSENNVFGDGSSTSLHFDTVLAALLKKNANTYAAYSDWNASYVTDYSSDLAKTDALGTSVKTRLNMYNPMYYLSSYYQGYQTSTVAKHWRIRTGIDQTDTALTVESNLALALKNNSSVKDVDFASVWGLGHTEAERTGDSTTNFISWVNCCM